MNVLGLNLIPETLVVPCQTEHVPNAQGRGTENITLHGDAIPVSRDHLHYRIQSHSHQQRTCRDTGHPDDCRLVVRNVDGIYVPLEQVGLLLNDAYVITLWRTQLRRYGK